MSEITPNKGDIIYLREKGQLPEKKYLILNNHSEYKERIGDYLVKFTNGETLSQRDLDKLEENSRKNIIVKNLIKLLEPEQATEEIIRKHISKR